MGRHQGEGPPHRRQQVLGRGPPGAVAGKAGDGLLLRGRTLYVVRNNLNQIAVVELAPDLSGGEVVGTITNPNFDVPTTIAAFPRSEYLSFMTIVFPGRLP